MTGKKIYLTAKQFYVIIIILFILANLLIPLSFYAYKASQSRLTEIEDPNKPLFELGGGTPENVLGEASNSANLTPEQQQEILKQKFNQDYKDKLTIIFYYNGYANQPEAMRYINVLKEALAIVEPFATSNNITTKIFTTPEQKCSVKPKNNIKLLDCDRSLISSFNALGIEHFKLVVLSPLEFAPVAKIARGKNSAIYLSTYQGTAPNDQFNRWLGLIFSHELGHSLGLIDEYALSAESNILKDEDQSASYRSQKPNCAPDMNSARQWWGNFINPTESTESASIGIFPGCGGKDTYYYPEKNTLMSNDPTKEGYGRVSTEYLRAAIDCFYANQGQITYPAGTTGKYESCEKFKKEYPDFWKE